MIISLHTIKYWSIFTNRNKTTNIMIMKAKSEKLGVTVTVTFKEFKKDLKDVAVKYELISSNGYSRMDEKNVSDLGTMFRTTQGMFCLVLNNKFINEKLIGKKVEGVMPIVEGSQEDIAAIEQKAQSWKEAEKKKERENIPAILRVKPVFHGIGKSFVFLNEEISLISDEIEAMVKMVDKQINWNMDWDNFIETEIRYSWLKQESDKVKEVKRKRKDEENKAREAKFKEAKETGEPVVLESYFLTNNDIPRKYREEDSDMGNLVTLAMPDGTIKEVFCHAY